VQFWSDAALVEASIVADGGENVSPFASRTSGRRGVNNTVVLIEGVITSIAIDFRTRSVGVHGSDQTRKMIAARSDESWPNQTASQIIAQIAARHGLTPHIDAPASEVKAGKTFDFQEFTFNSDLHNDWDTVVALAEHEGHIAFVIAHDLYVTNPGNTSGDSFDVVYSPPTPEGHASGNFVELRCRLDCELQAGASATVASLQTSKKAPVVGEQTIGSGNGGTQFYNRKAGLTVAGDGAGGEDGAACWRVHERR
jgi:hypothetical protein